MQQLILASVSPRREQLLKLFKIKFKAVDSKYKEVMDPKLAHKDLVKFLALGKATAAAKKYPNAIIIAADTIVSFKGKAIGKPKNAKEAEKMLKSFSNKSQKIITGVVILNAKTKKVFTAVDVAKIYLKKLSRKEILSYIKSKEPFDKAGGYAPHGSGFNFVKKLEGDFSTAIGLPMGLVYNGLKQVG